MARIRIGPPRLGRALITALLPLTLLAGCTEDDPEPAFTDSPSTQPEPTESQPTQPTEPVEPTPPATMNGNDEAAAKAFVGYYFELLDYAALTGDTTTLDSVAIETCAACSGASETISDVYKAGGSFEGGDATLSRIRVSSRGELAQGVRPYDAIARVTTERSVIRGTGDKNLDGASPGATFEVQFQFSHGRTGWRMSAWRQT